MNKETEDRIKADAEKGYPFSQDSFTPLAKEAYIAGATAEVRRADKLVKALAQLQEWQNKYPPGRIYSYDRIQSIEKELTSIVNAGIAALSEYNKL